MHYTKWSFPQQRNLIITSRGFTWSVNRMDCISPPYLPEKTWEYRGTTNFFFFFLSFYIRNLRIREFGYPPGSWKLLLKDTEGRLYSRVSLLGQSWPAQSWEQPDGVWGCPVSPEISGFSVHGIFQARILEWAAISFSRRSSWYRDWTQISPTVGRHFTVWDTREVQNDL